MSQANVEIVQRAFAAFERGDLEAALRLAAEDIASPSPPRRRVSLPGNTDTAASWKP